MFVSSIWHKHFRRRLVPVTDFGAKCRLLASVDVYLSLSLAPAPTITFDVISPKKPSADKIVPEPVLSWNLFGWSNDSGAQLSAAIRQKYFLVVFFLVFIATSTDLIQQKYFLFIYDYCHILGFLNYTESSSFLIIEALNVNIWEALASTVYREM